MRLIATRRVRPSHFIGFHMSGGLVGQSTIVLYAQPQSLFRSTFRSHGASTQPQHQRGAFGVQDIPAFAHHCLKDHCISFGPLVLRTDVDASNESFCFTKNCGPCRRAMRLKRRFPGLTFRPRMPPSTSRRSPRVTSSDRRACRRLSRAYL